MSAFNESVALDVVSDSDAVVRTLESLLPVAVVDRRGCFVAINDNFRRMFGYARDELLGLSHRLLNARLQNRSFWSDVRRTIGAGIPWRGEICGRSKDGAIHWGSSIISPCMSPAGQIERFIVIWSDITVSKLTEQQLSDSEALLDRTGRTAGIGGWMLDFDRQISSATGQMNRIHELPANHELSFQESMSFFTSQSRPIIDRAVTAAIHSGKGWDLELEQVTAKGRRIWVRAVGEVEFESGRPVRIVGSIQDITRHKQIEVALSYERDLLASLLETLPDGICFKDLNSRFLRVNPGLARTYGMKNSAEAIGKTDFDYLPVAHAMRTTELERQIIESGEPMIELEEEVHTPGGLPRWNLITRTPLYDSDDRIIGTFGISRDITARKLVDAQLQQTNERFAIAADSAGIGVWELDVAANVLSWDDWMYRIYGVARSAGKEPFERWRGSLHADDRDRGMREVAAALHGDGEFASEFRIVRPNGEIRYVKAAARTSRDSHRKAVKMTGVNFDVTDRRRAELELSETTSLLQTVLNSAADVSIVATDLELNITVFNAGAEKLLGYSSQEMVGVANLTRIHDIDELSARNNELRSKAIEVTQVWCSLVDTTTLRQSREWTYLRKDGRRIPVSLVMSAMTGNDGKLLGYVGVAHDVTQQKITEETMREATQKAEQASRAKSEFLANMSHEIRTPMNAVFGLSYLLGETALDEQQSGLLQNIKTASKSLLAVINDVLDLSKIEAGELIVESVPFDVRGLVKELAELTAVQARSKGITFQSYLPPDLPELLEGDPNRLTQILTNLLSNAIRFTDQGMVDLSVRQIASEDRVKLCFVVRDTGIGISPEAQVRLFAPFAQADGSITRRYGGTGLGLSIVKRLINLLGGTVTLKSTPGVGSEFEVLLEFRVAAKASPGLSPEPTTRIDCHALAGVRVLLVDDCDVNLEVTKRILELDAAQVVLAKNGQEALDFLREHPHSVDVVLMDMQMPIMDGHAATRRIRVDLGLVDLPIIALTAGALSSERQKAIASGMDDFVVKPFDSATLVRGILRHVEIANLHAATPIQSVDVPRQASDPSWPKIDGIDTAQVRARFLGDRDLFLSNLKRMLDEFSSVDTAIQPPVSLATVGARMHKLKGSAGTLGADTIYHTAAEAEIACAEGQLGRVSLLSDALARQLASLRDSASRALATDDRRTERESQGGDAPADSQMLARLLLDLRRQNLCAVSDFNACGRRIRSALGDEIYEILRACIAELQFTDAADALQDALQLPKETT